MEQVALARQQRELARQQLVASLGGTEETTFRQMTEMLPPEVQPLVDALVQEINQILKNVRNGSGKSHLAKALGGCWISAGMFWSVQQPFPASEGSDNHLVRAKII